MGKLIGILLLVCVLLGCAAKNYSTMTDSELQKALSDRQTSYDRNAANYHKYAGGETNTVYIGSPSAVAGAQIGGALGSMLNAIMFAKAAQTDKQEMEKVQQELDNRRKNLDSGVQSGGEAPVAPETGAKPKEGWGGWAVALEKAQDWQGMLAHSLRWTQAEPGNAVAWDSLGVAYRNLGRNHEAIGAFREALRLKPDDANAWHGLALAYAASNKRSPALEAVKELRRYDPQKADEIFNLIMKP